MAEKKLLPLSAYFDPPSRAHARISPDGQTIAFLSGGANRRLNIAIAPREDPDNVRFLTDAPRDILDFFWLPSGRHLGFFQDFAGEELDCLHLVDVVAASTRRIELPGRGHNCLAGLSFDHPRSVAVLHDQANSEYHDLWIVDSTSGTSHLSFANSRFSQLFVDHLLEAKMGIETRPDGSEEWFVNNEGKWRSLLVVAPEDAGSTRPLGFARSESAMYCVDSREREHSALTRVDLRSGDCEVTFEHDGADLDDVKFDYRSGEPIAAAFYDQQKRWFVMGSGSSPNVETFGFAPDGELEIASATLEEEVWTIEASQSGGPKSTYLLDNRTRTSTRLWTSRPEVEAAGVATTRVVETVARDGLQIMSYLVAPDEATGGPPWPTVFTVHGGPWERHRFAYDGQRQWLAQQGYLVVATNFRGSSGLGKSFLNAGNFEWGGRMIDDLEDVALDLVRQGMSELGRIGLIGMSFGGYAGLMAMTRPATAFGACVSLCGPPDLVALIENLPAHWGSRISLFTERVGNPATVSGRALLKSHSPSSLAERINGPVLLAHGAKDIRVGIEPVREFADALRGYGQEVELLEFEDEGHGLQQARNRERYFGKAEAFFRRHLVT